MRVSSGYFLCLSLVVLFSIPASADEGMWLFNNPPSKLLQKRYGFTPSKDWLEHVQKSSVRFARGSGSFVSPDGLVMTNHHVGLSFIKQLSTKDKNYAKDGFHARTRDAELKVDGMELITLESIEDVTAKINSAVKPGMKPAEAFAARRAAIAKIESESEKKTGMKCDVTSLYQGGLYHLYCYKRYNDVRLVFAPEVQIAFLGGDADNFSYPRFCLDMTFFRVFENGKPARIKHYLKWSKDGADEGELVFVSGHPGRTNRAHTMAELEYLRDKGYPYLLQLLNRWEVMASVYSGHGETQTRAAKEFLFGVANSRKAYKGALGGLQNPKLMARKIEEEKKLRAAIAKHPDLKETAKAWDIIAKAQKVRAKNIRNYYAFESARGFNTKLFNHARDLVRSAVEFGKPNGERLSEYADSAKKSLERKLFSKEPIDLDFETEKLGDSLTWLTEQLGFNNKLVQRIMAGKAPRERAAELLRGTKLANVPARKKLYKGGLKAVNRTKDPLIRLARMVDPAARQVRKTMETQLDEPKRQAYDLIAKAKFKLYGPTFYPDATFTLRLAFGEVKGYQSKGKTVPFETDFAGMYKHVEAHGSKYPFNLPPRWIKNKDKLNLKTPYNFVCTVDIIGGNSGSPVLNKNAEIVGLIFDGNVPSLVWNFIYTDQQARSVSVHSSGIIEALRSMYDANELAREIIGKD